MFSNGEYLKQFWLSKHFQVINDSISPRQKAEELRRLLYVIDAQEVSGQVTSQVHSLLNEKLSSEYSSVVDCMQNTNGLNNYNQLLFHSEEKKSETSCWKSALNLSSKKQPACVKDLLASTEKTAKDKKVLMKISFSQRTKKAVSETNSYCVPKESSQFTPAQQSTVNSATASRYAPLFGKRKTTEELDHRVTDKICKSSIDRQRGYSESNVSNNYKDDDIDSEEKKPQTAFLTAREQLIINKKKIGRYDNSNSLSTSSYGSLKKSLGTRRGVNTKFKPPVCDQEKEEKSSYNNNDKATLDTKYQDCVWMRNVDPKMVELIENEIMENSPGISWDEIAGLEFAKTTIQEIVIWPMLRPDIFTGLRGPPKGILLFGPPGTGKTLIGKCIASQSNATFFSISASSLTSKWIGEGEKMVRALFGVARCHQPAVIFIDEIDSLLTQRSDSEHESSRRIKTEFLIQLDGATCSADDRLLVVGATNRPQELDEAARRRLVKRLYIPLPECKARRQIIQNLMSKQLNDLTNQDLDLIMTKTIGFSGADMASLCREAALGPIRSISDIRNINAEDVRAISITDFEIALKSVRPSVSHNDMQVYVQWNSLYGCGSA